MDVIDQGLYRLPAFFPYRLLDAAGIETFWIRNTLFTIFLVLLLTLCAWLDHSFFISNGYGYLQHPGVFGWYLVQFVMPVAIYRTLRAAVDSKGKYEEVLTEPKPLRFEEKVVRPLADFVGLRNHTSRSVFALLFLFGFAGFAWNSFQNLFPGSLAPLDFWDSIHFHFGYVGSRIHKFYLHALLLPSIVHVFAGIVWINIDFLRQLFKRNRLRLALFNADKCGGFGFLVHLILTPTITALLVSGFAFFGVAYTHRRLDASLLAGIVAQTLILIMFYVAPTFFLKSLLVKLKKVARSEVQRQQEIYYEAIRAGQLKGASLHDAYEYLRYFHDISETIDKVPNWPQLTRVSRVFGISISPTLISTLIGFGNLIRKVYPNLL
jgi:hypothetical protein